MWRDLDWLLSSPPLLWHQHPDWQNKLVDLSAWIEGGQPALPASVRALDLQSLPKRLGLYAEVLLAHWLQHRGVLLAQHVQLFEGKQTIGELDFLVDCGSHIEHWELATKFYLAVAPHGVIGTEPVVEGHPSPAWEFVGPNLADSLVAKLHRMQTHQMTLTQHPSFLAYQQQRGWQRPMVAKALIKGWLFYPWQAARTTLQGLLHPAHGQGWWCTLPDFMNQVATQAVLSTPSAVWSEPRYTILPRTRWLASAYYPADATTEVSEVSEVLSASTLQEKVAIQLSQQATPVLVAQLLTDTAGHWREQARFFIVPLDWAQRAQTALLAQPKLRAAHANNARVD